MEKRSTQVNLGFFCSEQFAQSIADTACELGVSKSTILRRAVSLGFGRAKSQLEREQAAAVQREELA